MPRDERTYITVHDGMPEHPKIEGLSASAFRLLIETWCWCSRNRTDGNIPAASWEKRGTKRSRDELVSAGLIERALGANVRVHDYTEHQRTAAEIAELSEKRRAAGSKGGKAKATATASAKANAVSLAKQTSSKSVAESETDSTRHTSSTSARERAASFAEFWETYPRRVGRPDAMKAFERALSSATAETIIKGAARYRDDPNRDDAYTAHPGTWLRREGWNDDPLPARNGRQASATASKPPGWEFGMDR